MTSLLLLLTTRKPISPSRFSAPSRQPRQKCNVKADHNGTAAGPADLHRLAAPEAQPLQHVKGRTLGYPPPPNDRAEKLLVTPSPAPNVYQARCEESLLAKPTAQTHGSLELIPCAERISVGTAMGTLRRSEPAKGAQEEDPWELWLRSHLRAVIRVDWRNQQQSAQLPSRPRKEPKAATSDERPVPAERPRNRRRCASGWRAFVAPGTVTCVASGQVPREHDVYVFSISINPVSDP